MAVPAWSQDTAAQLRRAEGRRERNLQELREAEGALADAVSREKSVLGALYKLDRRVDDTRKEVRAARKGVVVVEARIQATEAKIAAIEEQQDARRELVRRRVRANYKINYLTPDGLFAMALGQGHLQDTLVRLRYVAAIRDKDEEIIRRFVEDQQALKVERERLDAEKAGLRRQQATLIAREKTLQTERKARADGLAVARANRGVWSKTVREAGTEARKLRDLVGRLTRQQASEGRRQPVRARKTRPTFADRPTSDMTLRAQPASGSVVQLDWPVPGTVVNNASSELEGLTIRCTEGTSVLAVQAGTVEYADWFDGLGFGKLLVLNHGQGMRSFYAHLQDFAVAKGDVVAAGASVGTSGSTGSLLGPALYFEIRHHFDVVSFAQVRP